MPYAAKTQVPVEQSQKEIRVLLERNKAKDIKFFQEDHRALFQFQILKWTVRVTIPLPVSDSGQPERAIQQQRRQRWRAMLLVIKAKLEAISSGVVTFEEEFLPYFVTSNGKTVHETVLPALTQNYDPDKIPKLLN